MSDRFWLAYPAEREQTRPLVSSFTSAITTTEEDAAVNGQINNGYKNAFDSGHRSGLT